MYYSRTNLAAPYERFRDASSVNTGVYHRIGQFFPYK